MGLKIKSGNIYLAIRTRDLAWLINVGYPCIAHMSNVYLCIHIYIGMVLST